MSLPLSEANTKKAANWLKLHFSEQIDEFVRDTPYDFSLVAAIACQETAQRWILWIDNYDPEIILKRAVFDASGDFPGTTRSAFPKNRQEFENKYGAAVTQMLVGEANLQRKMPQPGYPNGFSPAKYLYKGYGIFQYDLQHIISDPDFFLLKKWYNFSDCMQKLIDELNVKAKLHDNLRGIVKAYNGAGARAENYANNVMQFKEWIT